VSHPENYCIRQQKIPNIKWGLELMEKREKIALMSDAVPLGCSGG